MLDSGNDLSVKNIFERLHEQSKYKLCPFVKKCREL